MTLILVLYAEYWDVKWCTAPIATSTTEWNKTIEE